MALGVSGTCSLLWWREEGLLGEEESFVGSLNPTTGDTYITARCGSVFPFGSLLLNGFMSPHSLLYPLQQDRGDVALQRQQV